MNFELKDFTKDVLQASHEKPVLVDFWAEWCGPCRVLGPVLERIATQNNSEWKLVKINSDEHPEISQKYGIRSIPNVKLFHKGEVINEFVGALPEPAIKKWLQKNIPNKYYDMILHAEGLLLAGDEKEAQKIFNEVLSHDSKNTSAKINLAKIYLFEDTEKALQLISELEETRENSDKINSIRTIADLLNASDAPQLENSPTKEIYLEAVRKLKEKKFDQSLEKFIEIIRTDRFFADDIARKACIAIFKFLGEDNEVTISCRRDFGRALYI